MNDGQDNGKSIHTSMRNVIDSASDTASVCRHDCQGGGRRVAGAITGFPAISFSADGSNPVTIGLGVSIINEIQGPRPPKDLGFARSRGQALGYGAMFGKMLNQNGQYEVAEGYYNDFDVMCPGQVSGNPLTPSGSRSGTRSTDLCKTGKLTPGRSNRRSGRCAVPAPLGRRERQLRVDGPSRYITMRCRGWHNADSHRATTLRRPAVSHRKLGRVVQRRLQGRESPS